MWLSKSLFQATTHIQTHTHPHTYVRIKKVCWHQQQQVSQEKKTTTISTMWKSGKLTSSKRFTLRHTSWTAARRRAGFEDAAVGDKCHSLLTLLSSRKCCCCCFCYHCSCCCCYCSLTAVFRPARPDPLRSALLLQTIIKFSTLLTANQKNWKSSKEVGERVRRVECQQWRRWSRSGNGSGRVNASRSAFVVDSSACMRACVCRIKKLTAHTLTHTYTHA